jgi:cytochrome c peroxidase
MFRFPHITLGIALTLLLLFAFTDEKPQPELLPSPYDFRKFPDVEMPADNPLTKQGVWLGRLLFYDTLLSGNNRQACASCHMQQYAFTDNKARAVGSKGDTVEFNSMTLINLAAGNRFFWDGRVHSLEELIKHPITHPKEMMQDSVELIKELKTHAHYPALFGRAFPDEAVSMITVSKAIAQFIRIIYSNGIGAQPDLLNIDFYANDDIDTVALNRLLAEPTMRGMYSRLGVMCTPCHTSESFGGELMANNLLDARQQQLFKVPSVINALLTAPYMHDGRFATPEAVINHYDSVIEKLPAANPHLHLLPIKNRITDFDKKHFAEFLALFTDSSVLKNPALSNPFASPSFIWDSLGVKK